MTRQEFEDRTDDVDSFGELYDLLYDLDVNDINIGLAGIEDYIEAVIEYIKHDCDLYDVSDLNDAALFLGRVVNIANSYSYVCGDTDSIIIDYDGCDEDSILSLLCKLQDYCEEYGCFEEDEDEDNEPDDEFKKPEEEKIIVPEEEIALGDLI